jgi:hypothetical protein
MAQSPVTDCGNFAPARFADPALGTKSATVSD